MGWGLWFLEEGADSADGDAGGLVAGEAEIPRGDAGESDALQPVLACLSPESLQGGRVGGIEEAFARFRRGRVVHGPHGVNDPFCVRQSKARGRDGTAGRTGAVVTSVVFDELIFPCSVVDGLVDAQASGQGFLGGVHDSVDIEVRHVTLAEKNAVVETVVEGRTGTG